MSIKTIKNTYLLRMPDINSGFFHQIIKRIPYNYLPVNCEKPIYNFLCDRASLMLNILLENPRQYITMSSCIKMILEAKNGRTYHFKIFPHFYDFPDPGITEMVCLYPELREIMKDEKLSRTVIEYCDAKTKEPLLYLFPSNTMQPPVGSGNKLDDALSAIDDDACCDLYNEIKKREEYMKIYFKNHEL